MADTTWLDASHADDVMTWPRKQEVREQLQVTDRTVERWVKHGNLRTEQRRIPGQKSFPVYNPEDLRILITKVVPATPTDTTRQSTRPTDTTIVIPEEKVNLPAIRQRLTRPDRREQQEPRSELSHKTYLSPSEASRLIGLSEDRLKRLAEAGRLLALRGPGTKGRWLFPLSGLKTMQEQDLIAVLGFRPAALIDPTRPTRQLEANGHAPH